MLIDPCAWCRCGGSSRLVASHNCLAGLCGQVLSPVSVCFCIQGEPYTCLCLPTGFAIVRSPWWGNVRDPEQTPGGGADGTWSSGEPARPRADDSAFAGPRSPAPPARGGASGRGRAALTSCSCLRLWCVGGMIIRRSDACQPKKLFLFSCLVSVPSIDMSFQALSQLVVSMPALL